MEENRNKSEQPVNRKKTLFISLAILLIAAIITFIIFSTEPTAQRGGATKQTAMLVDVVETERGDFHPEIVTTGTVIPANDINLAPRVSGEIISLSRNFTPGGFVRKGEVLVQIDPSDYKNTLQLRKSDLQQAQADLKIEMGRQNVAKQDYQLLDESLAGENKSLVLREPQLDAAKANIEAAQAAVNQAELDLQRTTVRSPFNAHILSRNVNVGSQIAAGEELGRIVGFDEYWVELMVPLSKLPWLIFPEKEGEKGSLVKIRNRTSWKEDEYRQGYLYKLIGSLENQTRLARVLVAVEDPLARKPESEGLQPLIIGAFMETSIQGKNIQEVFRLNRDFVRQDETVWIMEDEKLQIRDVDIIFQDAFYAYISSGLDENEKVVTTNLSTVTEGVNLRVETSENTMESDSVSSDIPQSQNGNQTSGGI